MNMNLVSATVINPENPVNAQELAKPCGVEQEWVVRIVEVGIIQPPVATPKDHWQFISQDIARALEARQLQQMLDTNLDAVAMLMDLSQEIRRLKALIRTHGIDF